MMVYYVYLKAERGIKSICLPAYCCDSMIRPFIKADLNLRFYDVVLSSEGLHRKLPQNHGCDVVLLLDYFGFSQQETAELAERERLNGTSVILDCVQSFFSESDSYEFADYTIMSWRKWFFSCAAAATKRSGAWFVKPSKHANEEYVSMRNTAAKQKAAFLKNGTGVKNTFLQGFMKAEKLLNDDFAGYCADTNSVELLQNLNTPFLKNRRRANATVIYDVLNELNDSRIRPLFLKMGEGDVPMFVPVLVRPALRKKLRQFLIERQVYCPIHWPETHTGGGNALYEQEMSLICDQRYDPIDIQREMQLIKEFFCCYA